MPKQLVVQFTPIKSCLVNLPSKWSNALLDQKKLPQNVILEITSTDTTQEALKKTYCGWSGESSKPLSPNFAFTHGNDYAKLDVLEMDPQLGRAVGFQDGQKVNVEFCRNIPECTTVHVEPLTEDDWEILELHAGYVEEHLLSQIRAVYVDQIMCVWIHNKTLVRLLVARLEPKEEYAKLSNLSEVIVAPKVRRAATADAVETDLSGKEEEVIKKVQPSVGLRVCSAIEEKVDDVSVTVHPDCVQEFLLDENGKAPEYVRMTKLIPYFVNKKRDSNGEEEGQDVVDESQVNAVFATLVLSKQVPLHHVQVGSSLACTLEIEDFDMVKISATLVKKSTVGSLVFKRFTSPIAQQQQIKFGLDSAQQAAQQKVNFENAATQVIQQWLGSHQKEFAISQGLVISLDVEEKREQFIVSLGAKKSFFGNTSPSLPSDEQYTVLSPTQTASIEFGENLQRHVKEKKKSSTVTIPQKVLGGVDKLFTKIQHYALAQLNHRDLTQVLNTPRSGGILLTGAHGSGKTSLVQHLLSTLRHHAYIHTLTIPCSELAEERIPVFKDMLQTYFDKAAWHGPSVLFFDDLDRLIPAELEHADSTRSRHLAELFVRASLIACSRHPIMVIATSQQQQSIHPALVTHHVFSELCHLQPPNRDERKMMMKAMMEFGPEVLKRSVDGIDLVMVAGETEGFLAADLEAFVERAVHEGAVRSIKQVLKGEEKEDTVLDDETVVKATTSGELRLVQADFSKAREGFVPSSLRGIKLQSSGVNWSDIGGLNETRKTLLETLEWPTKYAAVFAQCPLRLRSGLLLYGYPGCGKTLLASAVAKECGLNFISVKGPEILNKYIGASEKSVRDLFERAQAAKPCVLFFDEFDSIAPRRGHDSTGVTDRVVNQMLTQMDGAEGLDGVYVLAATSRPDLIDPALLRPGRLDKALLCGLPTREERLEILQALSSKMTLAPEVDLKIYAEKTESFSGADLQGFLYNAHLEAIHGAINMETFKEIQNNKSNKKDSNEKNDFVMNQSHKAPLTAAERGQISQRLAMIKKGVKSNDENTTSNTSQQDQAVIEHNEAKITTEYLEKSLKSTRPSITIEEAYRLSLIYNEFVTGRTGELPSGEGDKGVGKRSTLG